MKKSFREFIEQYLPKFKIDNQILGKIVDALSLWANKDEAFNELKISDGDYQKKMELGKGILLIGPVGTGKTWLLRALCMYMEYLKPERSVSKQIVWEVAHKYATKGEAVLEEIGRGIKFYDELCLKNERTGFPDDEYVMYFGNRKLIGDVIIRIRYELFEDYGAQTLFSSNERMDELKNVYGNRAASRLYKMCNVLYLVNIPDRRKCSDGDILTAAEITTEDTVSPEEQQAELERINEEHNWVINEQYALYKNLGRTWGINPTNHKHLVEHYEGYAQKYGNPDVILNQYESVRRFFDDAVAEGLDKIF